MQICLSIIKDNVINRDAIFDAVGLPHTNEPVQFWIGFGSVLIGGSGLNPLGLLTPHWIIQLVIDRIAIENL